MPRAFRSCNFCSNNSRENPGVSFFSLSDRMIKSLKLSRITSNYICETHFTPDDIIPHSQGRRLRFNALPIFFPREDYLQDHDYFPSKKPSTVKKVLLSLI